jgi:ubiquinone/menaquinone biosynthesis C-methylase UbiE
LDQRDLTAQQFGAMAARYLSSSVHAKGADLDRIAELASVQRPDLALDLGCGAGHASFALARGGARRVIAYDLSAQMLGVVAAEAAARGYDATGTAQIETRCGPAELLPFADASVDMVVTRFSAHHWLDVSGAFREVSRVLRPDGLLTVIDVLSPESPLLDTVLQTLEILRDASHVRNYRTSEWTAVLDGTGFTAPKMNRWKLPMQFDSWIARIGTPAPRVEALKTVLQALPEEARGYFALQPDFSFVIDAGSFEATRVDRRSAS